MTDEAFGDALVTTLSVKSVNLLFSMKRTVKVGDEFRSFEASEGWTFKHESYDVIPPQSARKIAHVYGPMLIKNVVLALHVGGVLPVADAEEIISRVRRIYRGVSGDSTGDH